MGHESSLVKVAENGRLSIPARYRKQLGLNNGGVMVARVEDGELRLRSVRDVLARLQDEVSRLPNDAGSGVDWLMEQRRQEVAREESEAPGISCDEHSGRERSDCAAGAGARSSGRR